MKYSARERLIRSGIEILSEKGFNSTGIEEVISMSGVPRGSFYYYFNSKSSFGVEVIDEYSTILSNKLQKILDDRSRNPIDRLKNYISETEKFLIKYDFKRGCLIGNISLDIETLDHEFREKISATFERWSQIVDRCLIEARDSGDLPQNFKTKEFANFFWIVWEGVILRARLERSVEPLRQFQEFLFGRLLDAG